MERRLAAILARDRFMPSQFRNRGDRLVFSNGIVILGVISALLIVLFSGMARTFIGRTRHRNCPPRGEFRDYFAVAGVALGSSVQPRSAYLHTV